MRTPFLNADKRNVGTEMWLLMVWLDVLTLRHIDHYIRGVAAWGRAWRKTKAFPTKCRLGWDAQHWKPTGLPAPLLISDWDGQQSKQSLWSCLVWPVIDSLMKNHPWFYIHTHTLCGCVCFRGVQNTHEDRESKSELSLIDDIKLKGHWYSSFTIMPIGGAKTFFSTFFPCAHQPIESYSIIQL